MRKIIVIGCPGSGKTTFAERLAEKSGLELFYLDSIWHKADRTHIAREEFDMRLSEILGRDSFIIDGNYSRTLEWRISMSDTVILLICQASFVFRALLCALVKKERTCRG